MRQGGMKPKVTALVFTEFVQMQTLAVVVKSESGEGEA